MHAGKWYETPQHSSRGTHIGCFAQVEADDSWLCKSDMAPICSACLVTVLMLDISQKLEWSACADVSTSTQHCSNHHWDCNWTGFLWYQLKMPQTAVQTAVQRARGCAVNAKCSSSDLPHSCLYTAVVMDPLTRHTLHDSEANDATEAEVCDATHATSRTGHWESKTDIGRSVRCFATRAICRQPAARVTPFPLLRMRL